MQNKIIIRPEAEQDLSDAFDWYEDKRDGLGNDFLAQVKSALMLISQNPLADTTIIVLGVIHDTRHPNIIKRRINNI